MHKHKKIHINDCHRNFTKFRELWMNLNSTENCYTVCTLNRLTPEEVFENFYGAFKCFIERSRLTITCLDDIDDNVDFIEFDI